MGGESTELAPPPVLSAPRLASVGPSVASAASQSDAVAAAGGAASTAASPSSTMTEGAERFRGLWEDEMFARQPSGRGSRTRSCRLALLLITEEIALQRGLQGSRIPLSIQLL